MRLVLHLGLPPSLPASALEQSSEFQPAVGYVRVVCKEILSAWLQLE